MLCGLVQLEICSAEFDGCFRLGAIREDFSMPAARRETQLVSALLYHALTTGAGSRTLGEEYCDLLQVTGAPPRFV